MTNLTINNKARTIEMTKKFEKAASRFGSDEYKMLQEARKDYPAYKVVTKTSSAKSKGKDTYKGLTYGYMEKYIEAHDDENKTTMSEFKALRGIADNNNKEEAGIITEARSYKEIKVWFLAKFPAIKNFQDKQEKVLKSIEAA